MPLKNKTSSFSWLVLQTSYVSNIDNVLEDVINKDTFYSVLADIFSAVFFEPEYTAEEMQRREAKAAAALALQEDMASGQPPEAYVQCILVHVGIASTALQVGEPSLFGQYSKHEEFIAYLTIIIINTDWTSTEKVANLPFNR